jgi:ABC-type branched-subunit amino acid transport system substrate-binding protein
MRTVIDERVGREDEEKENCVACRRLGHHGFLVGCGSSNSGSNPGGSSASGGSTSAASAGSSTSGGSGSASGSSTSGGSGTPSGTPVSVLAMVDLSGPTKIYGEQELTGINAAAAYYNANGGMDGHPVKVTTVDTTGDPTTAVNDLVQKESSGSYTMVYPGSVVETSALITALAKFHQYGVALLDPAGMCAKSAACPNVFTDIDDGSEPHISDADWFKAHGYKKIGILQDESPFTEGGTASMVAALKKTGLQEVTVSYPATAVNITSEMARLKSDGVDAVEGESLGATAGYAISARQSLSWKAPILFDTNGSGLDLTKLVPSADLSQVYETLCPCQIPSDHSNGLKVLEKYAPKGSISTQPANLAGDGWDAIVVLANAVAQAHSLDYQALTKATESFSSKAQHDPLYIVTAKKLFSSSDHQNIGMSTSDFPIRLAGPVSGGQTHSPGS